MGAAISAAALATAVSASCISAAPMATTTELRISLKNDADGGEP